MCCATGRQLALRVRPPRSAPRAGATSARLRAALHARPPRARAGCHGAPDGGVGLAMPAQQRHDGHFGAASKTLRRATLWLARGAACGKPRRAR
jgi:hypothetical protein